MSIENGTYGVVLTTFDQNGKLDSESLEKELTYCINTSVTGLLMCGSTSEFIYLSPDEYKTVLRIGAKIGNGRKVMIAGVSGGNELAVRENLDYAAECGYRYAIICPPYYYPQTPRDILSFYEIVARNAPSGIKLLLYNIPFCAPEIPADILPELIRIPNIIGMKDSSGNMLYMMKALSLVEEMKEEFSIFTGQDSTFLPSLAAGACGCMSALAWIMDRYDTEIMDSYRNGRLEKGKELQIKLIPLIRHMDSISFPENYRALSEVIGVYTGFPQRSFEQIQGEYYEKWKTEAANIIKTITV